MWALGFRYFGLVGLLGALLGSISAMAEPVGAGLSANTFGVGASVTWPWRPAMNVRVGTNRFSGRFDQPLQGIDYRGKLMLSGHSVLLDWYPNRSNLRISTGVFYSGSRVTATARFQQAVVVGSRVVNPSNIGHLEAEVRLGGFSPYLGLGWGNALKKQRGWSVGWDLGLIFQKAPKVSLKEEGSSYIPLADVLLEQQSIEEDLSDLSLYPLLSFTFHYTR